MNGSRDHFFSSPALSCDQHGRFAVLQSLNQSKDALHGCRTPHRAGAEDRPVGAGLLLVGRQKQDQVADQRVADLGMICDQGGGGDGDQTRTGIGEAEGCSPAFAHLAIQQCLAELATGPEQFFAQEFFDGASCQLGRDALTQEIVEQFRDVQDAEGRIETDKGPAYGSEHTRDAVQSGLSQGV